MPTAGENCRRTAAERAGVHRREQEGTGHHMVSCLLLTPLTFLCAATPCGRAAKRGVRGLGSVRRADFGTLLCPEVSLRDLPRITVRGQTVQGGSGTLRKAPLRSSVDPWSTKRHCGPLAFRRATEGSRGLKEGLGASRGGKGTIRCPCPLLSPPGDPGTPRRRAAAILSAVGTASPSPPGDPGNPPAAGRRHFPSAVGYGLRRLQRRAAVSAERLTLC